MYNKKTGKLFEFSFSAPFILTNQNQKRVNFSKKYGLLFGLIFQIIDDLLDENKTFENIGKTPGKDKIQGKRTLLSILGEREIVNYCKNKINKFIKFNEEEFKNNPQLKTVLNYNLDRVS